MASFLPSMGRDNISFMTIPIAWIIALTPRLWARYSFSRATGKDIDIGHPREFSQTVAKEVKLDSYQRGRIIRAEAALSNGFENVGLFAAAVVAGNAAKLSTKVLNGLCLAYLGSRLGYNIVYVQGWPKLRIAVYFAGLAVCFTLFLKAGASFQSTLV